ncbi:MAG: glycerate kinase [Eubacterium sp.]
MDIPKSGDLNYIFGTKFKGCVKPIDLTYACDVENEFFGKNGAAYVFAGQKGANKTQIEELDEGLKRLNAFFPSDISKIKGAGAAGGLCGGLYAIYGGEIKSGFDILSEYAHLEDKIAKADLVITGEGKTDNQTLMGKLPYKISELCKKHGTKCTVISGKIENVSLGDKMISLVDENTSEDEAIENAAQILEQKAKYVLQ